MSLPPNINDRVKNSFVDNEDGTTAQQVAIVAGSGPSGGLTDTQLRANPLDVIPLLESAGHLSLQTNADGTTYTAFSSQACKQLTVSNQSGTTLEFQQGGSGVAFQVPTGSFYTFFGLSNASSLGARRVDTSTTQVTIQGRWEA